MRNVLAALVRSVSFRTIQIIGMILYAAFVASEASAAPKSCKANYVLDNAGTISTGWKDLGPVGGTFANKKKKCRELAREHCSYATEKLNEYAPAGSANFNAICSTGGINVYVDTEVEGKKNTKDTSCRAAVSCNSIRLCPCPDGYWQENEFCVGKACQPVNPKPANNTSFINTGYFFWEGELRHRIQGDCKTIWVGYGSDCAIPCPLIGSFDSANCWVGEAPPNTTAFIYSGNFYYSPVNGNQCPRPGSWFDGANCFVTKIPAGAKPFIWTNMWYVEPACHP